MRPEEVADNAVAGQYGPGGSAARRCPVSGRRRASTRIRRPTLMPRSLFMVDNWRWAGVPFYIRTGKALPKRVSEIAIQFRSAPLAVFRNDSGENERDGVRTC